MLHETSDLMWSWTLLFPWQTWLAATGQMRRHRSFGMAGIALFTLAVWIGASVAVQQLNRQLDAGAGDPARAFLAMPMNLAMMMIVLFAAAIFNVRRPDVHARLMLLVTLVALTPALARLTGDAVGTGSRIPAIRSSADSSHWCWSVSPPPGTFVSKVDRTARTFTVAPSSRSVCSRARP